MKYVEIIAAASSTDSIVKVADKVKALDCRLGPVGEDGMRQSRLLVSDAQLQNALDILQQILGAQPTACIAVLEIEAILPKTAQEQQDQEATASEAREKLYAEVDKSARLDSNFIVLVVLSTLVAVIGLVENNPTIIIGAMVIAPLLGPNLALSLGTALGDLALVRKAARTLLTGICIAVCISVVTGLLWDAAGNSQEIISRTQAGFDSIVLALASGAAAALSLTTGLSSVLVGVMVAVALLPPASTFGLMLAQGEWSLAIGAAALLAVNIVCVNLASKLVFFAKAIRPRTWFEKETARRAMMIYLSGWVITLGLLVVFICLQRVYVG